MNVAIYARVSTMEQAKKGTSIPEQIDRCKKYCEAMNWRVYDVYKDPGFSGASTERPALKKLCMAVTERQIDKIVVYKLDRLSRSQKDTLRLIEDVFMANNVDFVSISESFDTSTAFGRAMVGILSVFAQLERENIKERMAMGRDSRAKSGKYYGGRRPPTGYDYTDGKLVPNDYEAMLVRRIFEMYDSGLSAYMTACEMNAAGLTKGSSLWTTTTVLQVLGSWSPVGYIKHRGEWIPGEHDPIVDLELHQRVQERLQNVSDRYHNKTNRRGRATSLLGGLVVCGECGNHYVKQELNPSKKGQACNYVRYICRSQMTPHARYTADLPLCYNKKWRMEELDGLIIGEIGKLKLDEEYLKSQMHQPDPEHDDSAVIEAEIKKLDGQLSRLLDLYAEDETIDRSVLNEKVKNINDRKASLSALLEQNVKPKKKLLAKEKVISLADSFRENMNFEDARSIIETLIDHVEVSGDDVSIYWNF